MKRVFFLLFFVAAYGQAYPQYSRYIIRLNDKAGTPYSVSNPSAFLSPRSIARRERYGLPVDQTDLPVTPAYLDSIRLSGTVSILSVSKWLNQVCIRTSDAQALANIRSFSFVISAVGVAARSANLPAPVNKQMDAPGATPLPMKGKPLSPMDVYNYGNAYTQISLNNTTFLHNLGFTGEGMQLALMDAGFYHYKTLPTFDSIRAHSQVLGTWDFVQNEASVDEDNPHGMACLSTIAANLPGSFVGSSPRSSFYLFRTEDVSGESPIEEQNWVAAAERADSLGVDVCSVSLGYNLFDNSAFNYSYSDMNGKTSMIARAANMAAAKGMLVVAAAGNEGAGNWKYITTPADAEGVLAVAAVDAARQPAPFSSYGPSADGRVKPDVAAMGQNAVIADPNTGAPSFGSGTSYACPIMAGTVTCLWQAFPEVNSIGIIEAVRRAGDHADAPDSRTGYGIPDAKKAFVALVRKTYTRRYITADSCTASLSLNVKAAAGMKIVLERKLPGNTYRQIDSIPASGAFDFKDFNFHDQLPGIATNLEDSATYRLTMRIGTDTSFYLDSATLHYNSCVAGTGAEKILVSPNPAFEAVTVRIFQNIPTIATVVLYGTGGQKLYSSSVQVNGTVDLRVPMGRLPRGVYVVCVLLDGKKALVKKILRAS